MEIESRIIELLERIGIRRGQKILDFGCGYGVYSIPIAKIVGVHGRVYALDKDKQALDTLMQKAEAAGLKNIYRMDTSGELEIRLIDESVDEVLLFDVFHSFYFPQVSDRRKLLSEIRRVMKTSAFLAISVWPNLIEPACENDIRNAHLCLEKDIPVTVTLDNENFETCRILCFTKVRYAPPQVVLNNQFGRRHYE